MPGLEHSFGFQQLHTSTSALGLMSDGVASEQVKKFFFTSGKAAATAAASPSTASTTSRSAKENDEADDDDSLEVYIPEVIKI